MQRLIIIPLLGLALLLGGCVSSTPVREPTQQTVPTSSPQPLERKRYRLIRVARDMLGTPYRYGGASPRSGFDCSGLVQYTHRQIGLDVPRTTGQQRRAARPVQLARLSPGDLLFFRLDGKPRHVGIYEGDGQFIHAPSSGKTVSRATLDNPYWRRHLIGGYSFF